MRWWIWVLAALFLFLQFHLWVGDGSLAEVWHLSRQVETQRAENGTLKERNQALEAEVHDLKQGQAAIEERAREELGMVGKDETFYQIVEPDADAQPAASPAQ